MRISWNLLKIFIKTEFMKMNNKEKANARKRTPIYSGVVKYFPDAIAEIARVSFIGNEQHNKGEPLHWARGKSPDEPDALMRHLTDHARGEVFDDDGTRHLSKAAWRALALLQKELEDAEKDTQHNRSSDDITG